MKHMVKLDDVFRTFQSTRTGLTVITRYLAKRAPSFGTRLPVGFDPGTFSGSDGFTGGEGLKASFSLDPRAPPLALTLADASSLGDDDDDDDDGSKASSKASERLARWTQAAAAAPAPTPTEQLEGIRATGLVFEVEGGNRRILQVLLPLPAPFSLHPLSL